MKYLSILVIMLVAINISAQNMKMAKWQKGDGVEMAELPDGRMVKLVYTDLRYPFSTGIDLTIGFFQIFVEGYCDEFELIFSSHDPVLQDELYDHQNFYSPIVNDNLLEIGMDGNIYVNISLLTLDNPNRKIGLTPEGDVLFDIEDILTFTGVKFHDFVVSDNIAFYAGHLFDSQYYNPMLRYIDLNNPNNIIDIEVDESITAPFYSVELLPNGDLLLLSYDEEEAVNSIVSYNVNSGFSIISQFAGEKHQLLTNQDGYSFLTSENSIKGFDNGDINWDYTDGDFENKKWCLGVNGNLNFLSSSSYLEGVLLKHTELNSSNSIVNNSSFYYKPNWVSGTQFLSLTGLNSNNTILSFYQTSDVPTTKYGFYEFKNENGIFDWADEGESGFPITSSFIVSAKANVKVKTCNSKVLCADVYGGDCPFQIGIWIGDTSPLDDVLSPSPTFQTCQPGIYNLTYVVEDATGNLAKAKVKVTVPLPEEGIFIENWWD